MACNATAAVMSSPRLCAEMGVRRDWKLIEKISADRAKPNGVVAVDFKTQPARNARGQHAMVRALMIFGYVRFTAAAENDEVSAYERRGLFTQIQLSDETGHEYLKNIDGRSILDDAFLRNGFRRAPLPGAAETEADLGAGTYDEAVHLPIFLTAPGSTSLEGAIPLATLQKRAQQAFTFRCGSAFPGGPAGFTINGYRVGSAPSAEAGLEVFADIVYVDAPVIDAPWSLREYERVEKSGQLPMHEGRHEYLVQRQFREDANANGGQAWVDDVDGITLTVGGETALAGITNAEWSARDLLILYSEPLSYTSLESVSRLSPWAEQEVSRSFGMFLPPTDRERAPAGRIHYKFNQQPNAFVRFLHRVAYCEDPGRFAALKSSLGLGSCEVVQLINGVPVQGIADPTAPKALVPAT